MHWSVFDFTVIAGLVITSISTTSYNQDFNNRHVSYTQVQYLCSLEHLCKAWTWLQCAPTVRSYQLTCCVRRYTDAKLQQFVWSKNITQFLMCRLCCRVPSVWRELACSFYKGTYQASYRTWDFKLIFGFVPWKSGQVVTLPSSTHSV
jgi:hypothetical protein